MTRQKNIDKKLLYVFLSVPLLSSIMSAIHLIRMVSLGNPMAMAIALAITFELGSIVSFVALSKSILRKLKKEMLIFIFIVLFLLQAFGNVYSSFDYIHVKLISTPMWLDSFREMFFNVMDVTTTKLFLAILIGIPIPIISLVLLKSAIDYFSVDDDEEEDTRPKFDNRGNIIGAKTYDSPAILGERESTESIKEQFKSSSISTPMPEGIKEHQEVRENAPEAAKQTEPAQNDDLLVIQEQPEGSKPEIQELTVESALESAESIPASDTTVINETAPAVAPPEKKS